MDGLKIAAPAVLVLVLSACAVQPIRREVAVEGAPQPAAVSADCPVTSPNGSQPPGEAVQSDQHHGNGELWVVLPPSGVVEVPAANVQPDGSLAMKFPWWRGVDGDLTITGRRLDGDAPPLRAEIPDGYGTTGFQATGLFFPSEGCWEVNGRAGAGSLTFVVFVTRAG